jgi:hypothetical protein
MGRPPRFTDAEARPIVEVLSARRALVEAGVDGLDFLAAARADAMAAKTASAQRAALVRESAGALARLEALDAAERARAAGARVVA